MKAIRDKFAKMNISRQRKYQLRMAAKHRCTICGQPSVSSHRCLKHLVSARERSRRAKGCVARYPGAISYILQKSRSPRACWRRLQSDKRRKAGWYRRGTVRGLSVV